MEAMIEASSDLLLPPNYEKKFADNLLCNEEPMKDGVSLVKSLLPVLDPPVSRIPWLCSTRYKTELCVSYASTGSCSYAERCNFAHGLQDLHVPFRHPKYKTELCRNYHFEGYCYFGSRCLFVHGAAEQRPVLRRGRRSVPCRSFRNFGICPYGAGCIYLHGETTAGASESGHKAPASPPRAWERKSRGAFCRTFSSFGFCLYGTRCRFRHVLPCTVKSAEPDSGLGSPAMESATPAVSPQARDAFAFSSQHLGDLLLPLALHLRRMESDNIGDILEQV
ncbi:cysteine three histidine 1 [Syngnathoides biaculeatus]|uniref:cysteine three histidine 1 n=1 Tax=Syngnathoides biaculeatus TaxID=300417 RepID=UPI002ADE0E23|nr:cysteine three histidine 1 [Syngnathoides biaculeatus]